jgi:hypothetical protein
MARKRSSLRLTPEVHAKIVGALRDGSYVDTAAAYAGISRPTLYRWLDKGDNAAAKLENGEELTENEELYLAFRDDVEEARAIAMVRNVHFITTAAQTTWQAAAWWLERSNPQMWGRSVKAEVSGPNNGPINVHVSSDELEMLVKEILQQDGEPESGDDA